MNVKYLILISFVLYESVSTTPVLKEVQSWMEGIEPEEKVREKRKTGLLKHLEIGGVGVKKEVHESETPEEAGVSSIPEIPPAVEEEPLKKEEIQRAKKEATDNVCIQEVGTGKTSCGRMVSARGPAMKVLLRNYQGMTNDGSSDQKMDKYSSMQSRTFDPLLPLTSLASAVTYAVPTTLSADTTSTIGHGLPAIATSAVPVAPVTHLEPLSFNLLSHPIPVHPMHAMFTHRPLMNLNLQRLELPKLPEVIYTPAEVKQPAYEVKPIVATRPNQYVYPSRYGILDNSYSDSPMICHPLNEKMSQQVIQIRPEVHVIEPGQKQLNATVEEFKSRQDAETTDEEKVREHLRQVNEIREEITQLNKAAQKIVDQQERLAEMQQRHIWRSGDKMAYTPYNDLRMYMVPTFTRANGISYPNTAEDIEFFMNMLKAGKKIGVLSDVLQPAMSSAFDATRLILSGDQNMQNSGSTTNGMKAEEKNTSTANQPSKN